MESKIEKIKVDYKGKQASARKLTVSSEIPIDIDTAWRKVQTSALLTYVAAGKVRFKPTGGKFPDTWKEGQTVSTRMFVYGFVPFGGIHSLCFERIDPVNHILQTREWDNSAKVWDHKITLRKLTDKSILYEDEIVIYGGLLTGLITWWAKSFYEHRQKRWKLVAAVATHQRNYGKNKTIIMNQEAISAIGQIIGAIAVLITLIYLAIQMKQNTSAIATSTYESTMTGFNDINVVVASTPELASIISRGCMNSDKLSEIETVQFNFILRCYTNQWWKLYKLYDRGNLARSEWAIFAKEAAQFLEQPGCKTFCEQNKLFSDLFEDLEKYRTGVISNFGFT